MKPIHIAENNFDLIRLCAALQVAVLHVTPELSPAYTAAPWARLLELFPGVPIFFFISGFLISRSYERTKTLRDYSLNRALRIFPALHVCVFLNLVAVAATGYLHTVGAGFGDVTALYLAKTTFLQFYNPDFMRGFGDGVLNGSLWTICVELQFYCLIPIIYRLFVSSNTRRTNIMLIVLLVVSLAFNRGLYYMRGEHAASVVWKLVRVSFLPWVYMFLAGTLAQRNFERIKPYLSARAFWIALPVYVVFAFVFEAMTGRIDNSFSPWLFFPVAYLLLTAAYYPASVSKKLLHGNDVSYGIYIYHVPVLNTFLFYGYGGSLGLTMTTVGLAIVLATASWFLIEKPSLSLKRRSAHPVAAAAA